MIAPADFYTLLKKNGITFFTNVPDSLLKDILSYIQDHTEKKDNITAQKEGGAVALAVGHYLATGELPLVTFQNSGLGHALNPVLSLASIYQIPMVMMIGWRGEPNVPDAIQYSIDGKQTKRLLHAAKIPTLVLPKNIDKAKVAVKALFTQAKKTHQPVAILVKKDTFEKYKSTQVSDHNLPMSREDAISWIATGLTKTDRMVSTTGMALWSWTP